MVEADWSQDTFMKKYRGIRIKSIRITLEVSEGDNPKTNKPPLKNMAYYVVKHFTKYV